MDDGENTFQGMVVFAVIWQIQLFLFQIVIIESARFWKYLKIEESADDTAF
jgi:hypothetical protein